METKPEVGFTEMPGTDGDLGIITLDRPAALNALSLAMIQAIDQQLEAWEKTSRIKAVVIQAVPGRAFCAGGDIRALYRAVKSGLPAPERYFADEYRLNKRIYHFPKPYIALMDGITMGGGAGVSIHGTHRVATERFVFAMPETGIGFYPDVGATYFLPRLPHKIGVYLGLTGAKITAADSLALHLVDHIVETEVFPDILQSLAAASLQQHPDATVAEILNRVSKQGEKSQLMEKTATIEACFSKMLLEDIMQALQHFPDAWCQQVAALLLTKSPTSLRVTLRQLQMGGRLSFDDCMQLEYALTCRFIQGHDFLEGIRALLIDKDNKPAWQPAQIEAVKTADIDRYFEPLVAS
jgi:enoyl-CoA hydratase/carnithine racemase